MNRLDKASPDFIVIKVGDSDAIYRTALPINWSEMLAQDFIAVFEDPSSLVTLRDGCNGCNGCDYVVHCPGEIINFFPVVHVV